MNVSSGPLYLYIKYKKENDDGPNLSYNYVLP